MNGARVKTVFDPIVHQDRQHVGPIEDTGSRPLEVNVLFTSIPETLRAIKRAAELARGLNARLRLLVAQVVPYAVPLETPPVLVEFQEHLFRHIARASQLTTRVDIFLCRDAGSVFLQHLPPRSVVAVGSPSRWWPTREERLARRLRHAGHEVLVVYGKGDSHA